MSPECECPAAGFCSRHVMHKHAAWHRLCQTKENYRKAWDDGVGPGQPKKEKPSERALRRIGTLKRLEESRRHREWVVSFRSADDKGLGDTIVRLLKRCEGKGTKVELRKMFRQWLRVCSCSRTEATERLNKDHPYE